MMHAVHKRLNDLQSIYLDDFEIVAGVMAAAIGTAKGKADKSGSITDNDCCCHRSLQCQQ